MNRFLLSAIFLMASFNSYAQTIRLVKEIFNQDNTFNSSTRTEYKEAGGILYLAAGKDLWRTDGSGANTTLIKSFSDRIHALTSFNNKLYFLANDGVHGLELWSTSGTAASTALVKDIFPGVQNGFEDNIVSKDQIRVWNGNMYFAANDGVHGYELYKSDGTAAGTNMIIDLDPVPTSGGVNATHASIAVFNNRVFFGGYGATNPDSTRWGLWSTDGTDTGTHLVHYNYGSYNLFVHGSKLYFTDLQRGFCVTDGTAAGTIPLDTLIDTFYYGASSKEYVVLNNEVYFTASDDHIHVTDGTVAGTRKLIPYDRTAFNYSSTGINQRRGICLTAFNNKLYYSSDNSLWVTDGTLANTAKVFPTGSTGKLLTPVQLVAAYGKLYFKSADTFRAELWVTDGTNAGTHSILTANANIKGPSTLLFYYTACGIRNELFPYNNQLLYVGAYDSLHKTQLYKFDPTPNDVPHVNAYKGVRIFPNPSTGIVNVFMQETGFDQVAVIDQVGRRLLGRSIVKDEKEFNLDLRHLSSGMYYLQFTGRAGTIAAQVLLR